MTLAVSSQLIRNGSYISYLWGWYFWTTSWELTAVWNGSRTRQHKLKPFGLCSGQWYHEMLLIFYGPVKLINIKGIYIHTYSDLNFPYGWILHYLPSRFLIKLAPGNRLLNRKEGNPNIFIWEKTTNHFKWTLKHVENLLECGKSSEHLSAVYLRVTEAEEAVNAFPSAHGLIYNCRNMYRSAEIFLFSLHLSISIVWTELKWYPGELSLVSVPLFPRSLKASVG